MPTPLLNIPARLKTLYEQSSHRDAADLAQHSFLEWIEAYSHPLTFFPEYTDHGIDHLNSVLASTDALIPNQVWGKAILRAVHQSNIPDDIADNSLLTYDDAVLLVLAVLLHDAAMALTKDQFCALVVPVPSSEYPLTAPALDPTNPDKEKPFPELFDDFLAEARRWDGRKLANILGTLAPDEKADYPDFLKHPNDLGSTPNWTDRHCRLYGEFIRQHHPRLAHHFALHGLPPITSTPHENAGLSRAPTTGAPHGNAGFSLAHAVPPALPKELPTHLKDLAGLIARSHGIAPRDTFDYFSKFDPGSDPPDTAFIEGTHPVYIMVLLRIADYLQMDQSRLDHPSLHHIRALRSPLSQREHKTHLAIRTPNIKFDQHDVEALKIVASPCDAETFLNLAKNIKGLQRELDVSWAVLGEVFSRIDGPGPCLSKLGLTLRRVKSNLDDPEQFMRNHNPDYFVAVHAPAGRSDGAGVPLKLATID